MAEWTNVRVARDLKERIDKVRGSVPFARWVADTLEERLKRLKQR